MAVTTNLTTWNDCDVDTGFTELPAPHASGAAPAQDTENYIQNNGTAASVSQATGQATGTGAGFQYTGTSFSWTSGDVVLMWNFYAAPTNLETWANGGARIGIGTEDNLYLFNAMGSNFGNYPYGGWQNTAIDPTLTQDAAVGSPSGTTFDSFCFLPNILAKITKGTPQAIDVVRYGRGDIVVTGTETFTSMATANDAVAARWGIFQSKGGGIYEWKGLISLGTSGTSASVTDANKTILLADTPRVPSTFNKIEVTNASSAISLTSVTIQGVQTSITGSDPVSPGDYETITSGASVDFIDCVFSDMGTFTFLSGTDADGCVFRRCDIIDITGGGTLTDCTVSNSVGTISLSASTTLMAGVTGNEFVSDGENHAVDLGTVSSTTSFSWGNTLTNYATGTTGTPITPDNTTNAAILVNVASGQTLTINIATGADIPSVKNTGSGDINISVSYDFTITGLELNTEVTIVTASTETQLFNLENATVSDGNGKYKAVYSHSGGGTVDVLIHHIDFEPDVSNIYGLTLPNADSSAKVQMFDDLNYENP